MNFRTHITTIKRREKKIEIFGGTVYILEPTGADMCRFHDGSDTFNRIYDLWTSCVVQEEGTELTPEMLSNLYHDEHDSVLEILDAALHFDTEKEKDKKKSD